MAAIIVFGAALCAVSACADQTPARASNAPACRPGLPKCPIEVAFSAGLSAASAVVEGRLSPEESSASYAFDAKANTRLQWSLSGPAVHVVLTRPDGEADGPGLPAEILLATTGRYVFSLSSNTMAEGIYGRYRLELRLVPSQ